MRKINDKIISNKYPIPNINDILNKIRKTKYFTTLDLASDFHQIEMNPKDTPTIAFLVRSLRIYKNAFWAEKRPAKFQRVMDNVFGDLIGNNCLVYLDDIIVFSPSLVEHIANLKAVFKKLKKLRSNHLNVTSYIKK